MKKYLFPALALGLVMTSCQSDEPFAPVEGGEKQVTFTLNLPGEMGTRANEDYNSGKGGITNLSQQQQINYTLVLEANGDKRVFTNLDATNVTTTTATFSPTVVLGRNYNVTAYATFDAEPVDVTEIAVSKSFNDESKDTYFKTVTHDFSTGELATLDLRRPFGKLRLVATDYKAGGTALNTEIESVKVTYHDQQTATFNAVEGLFSYNGVNGDIEATKPFEGYYSSTADETTLFADYIPANSQDNMVDFTVEVKYADSEETYYRRFNDIPVRRNSLTTLKGNFFTAGAQITVEVDDDFENTTLIEKRVTVTDATELQNAVNSVPDNTMIYFADDIKGDVTITQRVGVDIVIDGCDKQFDGTFYLEGGTQGNSPETLTFLNINFKHADASALDFIQEDDAKNIGKRYAHNVTVENCTFEGNNQENVVAMRYRQCFNMVVKNCTAKNLHSLMWASGTGGITLDNVTVKDSKNGVSFGTSTGLQVLNSDIRVAEYGIRADGENANLNITNTTIKAKQPIIVRKLVAGQTYNVALNGADLQTTELYHVVFTNGADDALYVDPAGAFNISGADDYNVYPMQPGAEVKANSQAQLANAIEAGATNIVLAEGEYVIPAAAQGKTLTFVGTGNPEDVKVAVTKVGNSGENCDYGLDGSTVTFDGVTITTNSSTYIGYARCKGTYKNCVINGTYTLYGNSEFENCTFNVSGDVYNIWTWGAPNATFNNCTFNCDGKSMLLYGQANTKLTMNKCVFNDKGTISGKAAIEIGNDYNTSYELIVNNATVNGFDINTAGINTNTTLWANKNSMGNDKLNVVVDGVDVY